jgi:hypothetical protein
MRDNGALMSRTQKRETAIRAVEQRVGSRLPAAYRRFLIKDGGVYEGPSADVNGLSGIVALKCFLVPWGKGDLNLGRVLDAFHDRVPPRFLPVARGPGGDLFCIEISGRTAGSIWFWDHEKEAEEGDPPHEKNLSRVSRSIDDLRKRFMEPQRNPDPWERACEEGDLTTVERLLSTDRKVRGKAKLARGARLAAIYNRQDVVMRLLDEGADVADIPQIAKQNGYRSMSRILVRRGYK